MKFGSAAGAFAGGVVAPARERGLKYRHVSHRQIQSCRSREGAWIEIALSANYNLGEGGRSSEGAWIEMVLLIPTLVCNVRSLPRGSVD